MSDDQLLPRLRDLAGRCANKNIPCATFFLTPAEQAEAIEYGRSLPVRPSFFGGYPEAERRLACFLPDYLTEETFDPSQFITAVHASAPFSSLSHRDFLGSLMGLGIERQCVGDIIVKDQDCWFFLTCAIASHVLDSMVKVGRGGVSLEEISLDDAPPSRPICRRYPSPSSHCASTPYFRAYSAYREALVRSFSPAAM